MVNKMEREDQIKDCVLCNQPRQYQSELCEAHGAVYQIRDDLGLDCNHEDMLVRIRQECCDGSTTIEIDNETHAVVEFLLENKLIRAKPLPNYKWYVSLTRLGKSISLLCIKEKCI